MRIVITLLFVFIVSFSASAQKTSRSIADDDFTTTPFQNVAKGTTVITEGYYEVENGKYTEGNVTIHIPLSFTPSKDEKFTIDNQAMVMKMVIYNMKGEKVHESKLKNSWNGKNKDEENLDSGLYIYTIDTRITPNRTSKLTGFVNITD